MWFAGGRIGGPASQQSGFERMAVNSAAQQQWSAVMQRQGLPFTLPGLGINIDGRLFDQAAQIGAGMDGTVYCDLNASGCRLGKPDAAFIEPTTSVVPQMNAHRRGRRNGLAGKRDGDKNFGGLSIGAGNR